MRALFSVANACVVMRFSLFATNSVNNSSLIFIINSVGKTAWNPFLPDAEIKLCDSIEVIIKSLHFKAFVDVTKISRSDKTII